MNTFRIIPLNRPVKPYVSYDYDSEAAQEADRGRIARYKALEAEFLKTWTPPRARLPDTEDGSDMEYNNIKMAAFDCWKLRQAGRVAAATTPTWNDEVEMWLFDGENFLRTGLLAREKKAVSLTLPFIMKDGEFSVTFETYEQEDEDGGIRTWLQRKKRLRVRSEHGIHFGELITDIGEMQYDVVSLPSGTPQDVADRVAAAYSVIAGMGTGIDLPKDYPVVMPLRENCTVCGRPFTDPVSKVIGLGPTCAHRLAVPHSAEAANRIVTARQTFLAEALG